MSDLSIFVDESGDAGTVSKYYLLALVLHDQSIDFSKFEADYTADLAASGLADIPLHVSPLINGHDDYKNMDIETRKRHLAKFRVFSQYFPFTYHVFAYEKRQFGNKTKPMFQRMKRDLVDFLFDNIEFFQAFDKVKVYYDDGQTAITDALHNAIGYVLSKEAIMYRDASPKHYRLSQLADYVCAIELGALKYEASEQTATDDLFFGERKRFIKDYLKKIRKKLLL